MRTWVGRLAFAAWLVAYVAHGLVSVLFALLRSRTGRVLLALAIVQLLVICYYLLLSWRR